MRGAAVPIEVLVVDDDVELRDVLRTALLRDGFTVSQAGDAKSAMLRFERGGVDLITLDLTLGSDDGLALARKIRAKSDVPIVMVTGKDDVVDRVVGLEVGADDYLVKPFHLREFVARVRAVLRRYAPASPRHDRAEKAFALQL